MWGCAGRWRDRLEHLAVTACPARKAVDYGVGLTRTTQGCRHRSGGQWSWRGVGEAPTDSRGNSLRRPTRRQKQSREARLREDLAHLQERDVGEALLCNQLADRVSAKHPRWQLAHAEDGGIAQRCLIDEDPRVREPVESSSTSFSRSRS